MHTNVFVSVECVLYVFCFALSAGIFEIETVALHFVFYLQRSSLSAFNRSVCRYCFILM